MKITDSKNSDFFDSTCYGAARRFDELPEPLEWLEPSINMLYLNSVSSFIFGNFFSSIISMGILLEHILRLAIYDKGHTGLKHKIPINKLDELGTISALIDRAEKEGIIEKTDVAWWNKVGKVLRNKSAHFIIPVILREFSKEKYSGDEKIREGYHPKHYFLTEEDGSPKHDFYHDFGSFFHKSDYFINRAFINDSTEKINKVIAKTNWQPNRDYWKMQEYSYNLFFEFEWDYEKMKESLEKA